MKKFAFVVRPDDCSNRLAKYIREKLCLNGYVYDECDPELVIVIGGDGTFIYGVHAYMSRLSHVKFYGIHTGTLGFYTDYRDDEVEIFLNDLLKGKLKEIEYPLLQAKVDGNVYKAINEIRIENVSRTQVLEVFINGDKFEDYRGTGMCVCTQLGSTAYNRSLGGAVIQEGLRFIEMSEIAGIHHAAYRSLKSPIVMNDKVKIKFVSNNFDGAVLGSDIRITPLDGKSCVEIEVSKCVVRMLRGKDVSYFQRLKSLF